MKIAVDGRSLSHPPTGITNVLICALNEFIKQNSECYIYILSNRAMNEECGKKLLILPNIVYVNVPLIVLSCLNKATLWYMFKVYFLLKNLNVDYFWAPANILPPIVPKGIKTILMIHDLVAKDFRHTMKTGNKIYNDIFFDRSINSADIIWAVSSYTKEEIEKRYPQRKCKQIFAGSCIDKSFFKKVIVAPDEKQALLKKYRVDEKFILYVGTLEPRKNITFLLSLMPVLAKEGFYLLVVGAKGWGKSRISDLVRCKGFPRDHVVFSGFVATEELVKLYNIAALFVSTSLNEGFGLPQLEAMNCGCPVVSAHNSAMIEIVTGAGHTVVGWDPEDWCNAVRNVFLNKKHFASQGFIKSEDYDWTKVISAFNPYLLPCTDLCEEPNINVKN